MAALILGLLSKAFTKPFFFLQDRLDQPFSTVKSIRLVVGTAKISTLEKQNGFVFPMA